MKWRSLTENGATIFRSLSYEEPAKTQERERAKKATVGGSHQMQRIILEDAPSRQPPSTTTSRNGNADFPNALRIIAVRCPRVGGIRLAARDP